MPIFYLISVHILSNEIHDDVIKWKHFPRSCAFVREFTGEFPAQRPVTRSFDVSFDLRLNKRLSKQSWRWWSETPSRPLWRHCNVWGRQTFVILLAAVFIYRRIQTNIWVMYCAVNLVAELLIKSTQLRILIELVLIPMFVLAHFSKTLSTNKTNIRLKCVSECVNIYCWPHKSTTQLQKMEINHS